jgi:hypothetical protein
MAARGTLIKKTQRQEAYCTNQPPSTGPGNEAIELSLSRLQAREVPLPTPTLLVYHDGRLALVGSVPDFGADALGHEVGSRRV